MLRIGIVAHTKRRKMAQKLFDEVDADIICFDRDGKLGCEGNHRRTWAELVRIADPDDWLIVLEDDAIPVPGFRYAATSALKHAPAQIVSLYLGQGRPPQWQQRIKTAAIRADADNASWIVSDATIHAVGIAMRGPEKAEQMLNRTVLYRGPIDQRISMWCRQFGIATAYAWPSLVDHRDEETVIESRPGGKHREKGRVAWRFGNRSKWTNREVTL